MIASTDEGGRYAKYLPEMKDTSTDGLGDHHGLGPYMNGES